jgi:hypothetical protein
MLTVGEVTVSYPFTAVHRRLRTVSIDLGFHILNGKKVKYDFSTTAPSITKSTAKTASLILISMILLILRCLFMLHSGALKEDFVFQQVESFYIEYKFVV